MDDEQFRKHGIEIIDFMADFKEKINTYKVTPSDIKPGFLAPLLPPEAPLKPESFEVVMDDFKNKIMKGVTYWNHRRFHAYFPAGNSFPSLFGDMLSDMFNMSGYTWEAGPSLTELEIIVLDWFAKALGLPEKFLSTESGGGVIQGSASDCILSAMMAARNLAIEYLSPAFHVKGEDKVEMILPKLVAYTSRESHSAVEKAAKLCCVKLRVVDATEDRHTAAASLGAAIARDKEKGLKPFFYSAILGSTTSAEFDDLEHLLPVIERQDHYFWLHVDGAYAGNSFICPEMRQLARGIERANSFNVNTNKWLLVHFDCSVLWVDRRDLYSNTFKSDPEYTWNHYQGDLDRTYWQVPFSRRFRALKLWFVLRMHGIENLQKYIRNHIELAKAFKSMLEQDSRFVIANNVRTGLVCFRLIEGDKQTHDLCTEINMSNQIHVTPSKLKDKSIIRFCVNYEYSTMADMEFAINEISKNANKVLAPTYTRKSGGDLAARKLVERRLSFTRSVSREQYERLSGSLQDGATPVFVIDEEEGQQNPFDDVFTDATSKMASVDIKSGP